MVMRYFGNKDQLFAAAADFDLQIPDLSDVDSRPGGRRAGRPLHGPVGTRRGTGRVVAVEHNQCRSGPTDAEDLREPAAARDRQDQPRAAERRAALVATQMLGLALCRYVLQLPPVVAMSHDEIGRLAGTDGSALPRVVNDSRPHDCR